MSDILAEVDPPLAQMEAELALGPPPDWPAADRLVWPHTFWTNVYRTGHCWYWMGTIGREGYPSVPAHRVSYEMAHGPIPEGFHVDHLCHNESLGCVGGSSCMHRRCVNPAHLEAVTGSVNALRAWERRRKRSTVGL